MKNSRSFGRWPALLIAIWSCIAPLQAQIAQPVPPPVQMDSQKLNAEELGQLLAPIALYPDALIALMLPASTVAPDVVMAARYLKAGGDPEHTENQPWDESVKSLTRYPEVLAWMDENLEWTSSVGEAFTAQPADVMSAIQALREQARAAGNLVDSPQQKVVEEEEVIRIVPADPLVIYVPQYDPQVVYVQSYSPVPVLTFGIGFAVGSWLCYDFDWRQRCFYRGNWCGWNPDWRDNRNHRPDGSRCGTVNVDPRNASQWQPSASAQRQALQRQHNNTGNARYISARPVTSDAGGHQATPANGPTARPAAAYSPERKSALPRPTKWEHPASSNGRPANPANPAVLPSTPDAVEKASHPEKTRAIRPGVTPPGAVPPATPSTPSRRIPGNAPDPLPPSARPPSARPQATPREQPARSRPPTVPTTAAPIVAGTPEPSPAGKIQPPHAKQPEPSAPGTSIPGKTARPDGGHPMLPPPCPVAPDPKPTRSDQPIDKPQTPLASAPQTNRPAPPAPVAQPQTQPRRKAPVVEPVQQPERPAPVVKPQTQPRRKAPAVEPVPQPERPAPVAQPQTQPRRQAPAVEPVPQQRSAPVVKPQRHQPQPPPTVQPAQQQRPAPVVQPQRPQAQPRQTPQTVQPVQQQQRPAPVVQPQSPSQLTPGPRKNRGGN